MGYKESIMNLVNLQITMNDFNPDIRVLKEALAVDELKVFDNVYIIALNDGTKSEIEKITESLYIWRVKLKTRKLPKNKIFQIFKYIEWKNKITKKFINKDMYLIIHCHNLPALVIGNRFMQRGAHLIYDAHELVTERNGVKGFRKVIEKKIEKKYIKKASQIITVSESIKEWYQERYNLNNITIIRNIQKASEFDGKLIPIRDRFNINIGTIIFVYCGNFFRNRGVDTIIDYFSSLDPKKYCVVFFGKGELETAITEAAEYYDNIIYGGFIPEGLLVRTLKTADIGIILKKNDQSLSQYFALPNKFFQYIQAGLPILISNSKEMEEYVKKYDIGWVETFKGQKCVETINYESIKSKKQNVQLLSKELTWKKEKLRLQNIYKKVIDFLK